MIHSAPLWVLLASSTNDSGVKFVSLARRTVANADGDYEELMAVLKGTFGAVEIGDRPGPYSVHKYLTVNGFCLGLILDTPGGLDLYARDERDAPALEAFIPELLAALNGARRSG